MKKQGLLFSAILLASLVTGCATTAQNEPQVQRLTPEEVANLTPVAVPTLSLEEIVSLSKQNTAADDIIAKIKSSNSQYDLTASQIVDLNKQGVDAKVLDYIQTEREKARQNSIADEINKREKANKEAQDRLRIQSMRFRNNMFYDPFFHPYYGFGFSPYWGNQFYFNQLHRRRR